MNFSSYLRSASKRYGREEGFYIIETRCSEAIKSIKGERFLPALFKRCSEFVNGGEYTSERLMDFFSHESLSDRELFLLNDYIALAALVTLKAKSRAAFSRACSVIRFTETYNFDSFYSEVSELDRRLSENPEFYYAVSDEATKKQLRGNIYTYAKENSIGDIAAAELLGADAAFPKTSKRLGILYFILYGALCFSFFIETFLLTRFSLLFSLLLYIPLSEAARQLTDFIFGKLKVGGVIPKLSPEFLPPDASALTIITTFLCGEENDGRYFDRLEELMLANRCENIRYGILASLPDADTCVTAGDGDTVAFAVRRINALNEKYNNRFCLFVRRRSYSEDEGKFICHERKRGGICELVNEIKTGKSELEIPVGDLSFIHSVRYIVTLDSDTEPPLCGIDALLCAAAHPLNAPKIRNGVTVSGYGVLQPRTEASLSSASATPFSLLLTGGGGVDAYSGAAFDLYQNVFGEGIFCGKGIFDVDAFFKTASNAFPDNSVLSHDLLEGCRLCAGYLSDVVFYDSTPSSPISYFKRLHRWCRGDIQALCFAFGRIRNANNEKAENPINSLSKFKLWDNLRRILVSPLAVLSLFLSAFIPEAFGVVLPAALLYLILPTLFSALSSVKHFYRRFFSFAIGGFLRSLFYLLYSVSALFTSAQTSLDALLRALFRINITKKRLLEWTTADDGEKHGNNLLLFLKFFLPSSIAGLLLMFFSPVFLAKLIGVFFFVFFALSYLLSKPVREMNFTEEYEKETLTGYCRDMWKYFSDNVGAEDNWLPPDNYQITPVESTAHRTSPTNIGLYLLSALAARDFGFIGTKELYRRLSKAALTVSKLPKWKGHLFNWYSTETLETVGIPYVSAVDSGNLIACLTALCQGLKEYASEDTGLIDVINYFTSLCDECDMSALFNKDEKLFHIGINTVSGEKSEGCYDLLMSECRIASYLSVARRDVTPAHWGKLSRIVTERDGFIGLLSWSGTAFEYFMPALFMPVYENSLQYEALKFALLCQSRIRFSGLWGKSECGYFAFDSDMNYQYKAVGVPALGLKRGLDADSVVSPYSSFLALCVAKKAPIANLRRLYSAGMYGKYGFYEALDMTPDRVGGGRAIIKSYMSHHVGMSIISAANAVFGNIFNKRFMNDPVMKSASSLLTERLPTDAVVFRTKDRRASVTPTPPIRPRKLTKPLLENASEVAIISNGRFSVSASSDGNILLSDGGKIITENPFTSSPSLTVAFTAGGESFCAADGAFSYSPERAVYRDGRGGISYSLALTVCESGFVLRFDASGGFDKICPMLLFKPVLMRERDYRPHPSFADLSVSAEYLPEYNALLYRRRNRTGGRDSYLLVSMEVGGKTEYETKAEKLLPPLPEKEDIISLCEKDFTNSAGACIYPICAVKKRSPAPGRYFCNFFILPGSDRAELTSALIALRETKPKMCFDVCASSFSSFLAGRAFSPPLPCKKQLGLIQSALYYPMTTNGGLCEFRAKNELWKHGISGDLPIIVIKAPDNIKDDETLSRLALSFIYTHGIITYNGKRFDLVYIAEDGDEYEKPVRNEIQRLVKIAGAEFVLGKSGGIFIVGQEEEALFKSVSALYGELSDGAALERMIYNYTASFSEKAHPVRRFSPAYLPREGTRTEGGVFLENGFSVIKSEAKQPWSYIYANDSFGFVLTQNSLGFSWYRNSRLCRLTPWKGDIIYDTDGEILVCEADGVKFDLCACSSTVDYLHGCAVYSGKIFDIGFSIRVGCDPCLPVKLIIAETEDESPVQYVISPALSEDTSFPGAIKTSDEENTVFFTRMFGTDYAGVTMFKKEVFPGGFLLGAFESAGQFLEICRKYDSKESFFAGFSEYEKATVYKGIRLSSGNAPLDEMMNYYLIYQARQVRFFARTGFLQSGGAFGFRDQLQDCLALLFSDPERVREHILRCAAHQFPEGDVWHWWHETMPEKGIRTRYSDDPLWLVYIASEYALKTGDYNIFDCELPYILSPVLSDRERERYESAKKTDYTESLFRHCQRALDLSSRHGIHGLPLMGGGDWNDGMNRVGIQGRGESVWLAMFYSLAVRSFLKICEKRGDTGSEVKYRTLKTGFDNSIEKFAWDKDRFLRAFWDDSAPMGRAGDNECALDVIPQCFYAILHGSCERSEKAMSTVKDFLWDADNSILPLLSPPFDSGERNPGYIRSYVPGLRENGGQYTHAAIWAAWGFLSADDTKTGLDILLSILPANRDMNVFRCEPYAICADIYTEKSVYARGGWSQYTGSASWYYRVILEEVLGYSEQNGEFFTITPRLTDEFSGFILRVNRHNTLYIIEITLSGENRIRLDGHSSENCFAFDGFNHYLKISVAK